MVNIRRANQAEMMTIWRVKTKGMEVMLTVLKILMTREISGRHKTSNDD